MLKDSRRLCWWPVPEDKGDSELRLMTFWPTIYSAQTSSLSMSEKAKHIKRKTERHLRRMKSTS